MGEQLADDPPRGVRRHGKAKPLGHGDDRRVDADDAAARVDQRAAGVAGVERRRVLHDVLDQPTADAAHRAAGGADHAGRHGRAEAQRVAHRDHELPDAQGVAVAQLGERQIAGRQPHQRQVGVRVVAHELGVEPVALFGHGGELPPAAGDVAVGQRVAVGREQHAGALPAAGFAARAFDAEHRGPEALDDADDGPRVGVEQFEIARRGGVALRAARVGRRRRPWRRRRRQAAIAGRSVLEFMGTASMHGCPVAIAIGENSTQAAKPVRRRGSPRAGISRLGGSAEARIASSAGLARILFGLPNSATRQVGAADALATSQRWLTPLNDPDRPPAARPPLFVGIDVGGTNIKIGIVDDAGRPVAYRSISTEEERGPADAAERIGAAVRSLIAEAGLEDGAVARVGLATPGPMDIPTGMLLGPGNLPHWHNSPIRDLVSKACGMPVTYANDANAAAYGEFWAGAARDYRSMVLFTMGTGIGGGIIVDEMLIEGVHSCGGELGHIIIDSPPTTRRSTRSASAARSKATAAPTP